MANARDNEIRKGFNFERELNPELYDAIFGREAKSDDLPEIQDEQRTRYGSAPFIIEIPEWRGDREKTYLRAFTPLDEASFESPSNEELADIRDSRNAEFDNHRGEEDLETLIDLLLLGSGGLNKLASVGAATRNVPKFAARNPVGYERAREWMQGYKRFPYTKAFPAKFQSLDASADDIASAFERLGVPGELRRIKPGKQFDETLFRVHDGSYTTVSPDDHSISGLRRGREPSENPFNEKNPWAE